MKHGVKLFWLPNKCTLNPLIKQAKWIGCQSGIANLAQSCQLVDTTNIK